MEKSYWRWYV